MKVENAGYEDIDALVKMRLDYLIEDNGKLGERESITIQRELPGYFQTHLGRDLYVYVIRDRQNIVSCAFLLVIEKPMSPAFINGRTGIVLNVYTYPTYRRRGYAGTIMKTLISEAKSKKLSVIELKSTDAGYALYRSVGFTDDCTRYHIMKMNFNGDVESA